jgi:hypothetical protein
MAEPTADPSKSAATKKISGVSDALTKPGDVIIASLDLTVISSEQPLDLKPFMMEINLYEDIFSPTLHGSVVIRDSLNLVGTLPIVGDEVLTIDIQTPWGEMGGYSKGNLGAFDPINKIQKSFSVYAVKNRKLNNDREQYYELLFCSLEAAADNVTKISKKFEGTTDEIVSEIFTENMKSKRFFNSKDEVVAAPIPATTDGTESSQDVTDETLYTELYIADTPHETEITFVSPMWSPIETLNWLAKRSIGNLHKSPTFLFYETTKGFYFASIEGLVKNQLENGDIYSAFVYNTNLQNLDKVSSMTKGFQTIEALEFITNLDILQSQDLGHFASTIHSFNMVKKEYTAYHYDHGFNYKQYNHMEDGKLDPASGAYTFPDIDKDDPSKTDKKYKMIFPINVMRSADSKPFVSTVNPGVLDSTVDSIDLRPEDFVSQRNSSLMDLTTLRLQITVPGRTDAEVGRMIKLYYPSVGEKTKEDSEALIWDKFISGIYMITAIRHQISPLRHTMFLEISKDSYAQQIYEVEEIGGSDTTENTGTPAPDPAATPTDPAATSAPATNSTKPVGKGSFIGDSIAQGLGSSAKGASTNATVGWNTDKIKKNYVAKGGSDYTVISMGSNDKGYPNIKTAENATAVRESIKSQTKKVIWILPYDTAIAQKIQGVASKYGDKTVRLSEFPSNDGLHPKSYAKVLERVNSEIGS